MHGAEIGDVEPAVLLVNACVPPGDGGVVDRHVALERAADEPLGLAGERRAARDEPVLYDVQVRHGGRGATPCSVASSLTALRPVPQLRDRCDLDALV